MEISKGIAREASYKEIDSVNFDFKAKIAILGYIAVVEAVAS